MRIQFRAPVEFPKPEDYLKAMYKHGLAEYAEAYTKVLEIAQAVKAQGGRALLVGGCVRDTLLGRIPKDFDIEVYKLSPEEVEEIVLQFGKVSEVGKAFGILKLTVAPGVDIDVSLPRTDSKIGIGHKGFAVKTDPHMTIEEAARRRDFTMNALAADPLTGELFDPFGGVEDLKRKVLRITDPERFRDDPLRVLRAMQFVGRFRLKIDNQSLQIMKEMTPQLKELPKERIGEEWKKLLLKAEKPSLGLKAGMEIGIFDTLHPELVALAKTPQDPEWHPEGSVWNHTLLVVDAAAKIVRREKLEKDEALVILLAALCHDLGKPAVTMFRNGHITSHGHEEAGAEPTKRFLKTIGVSKAAQEKVVKLVTNHLTPTLFFIEHLKGNEITDGAIRRLAKRIAPAIIQELVLVSEADHLGRGPFPPEVKKRQILPVKEYPPKDWLLARAKFLAVEAAQPADLTRGKDWLQIGFSPGIHIGKLIKLSNELRDEKGFTKEQVLALVSGISNPDEAINLLKKELETA